MKQLLIFRHAKAAAESHSGTDHARPLNEQGKEAAAFIGRFLVKQGVLPDLVCCSDSARTRQTFLTMQEQIPERLPVSYQNGLYLASAGDLLDYVNAIPEAAGRVMLVGHNPGMHQLARILSETGEAEAMRALEEKFPTAALAVVEFPASLRWSQVTPNSGRLTAFWRPKWIMENSPGDCCAVNGG